MEMVYVKRREAGHCNGTDWHDMNYVGLILRIKYYNRKLFFTYWFDASGSQKGLFGSVSSPIEFSTQQIDICIAQSEQRNHKDYFRTNNSKQEDLFKCKRRLE